MASERFWAFVVHINNPLNLDLDIIFPKEHKCTALNNPYTYQDEGDDNIKESKAYRCRIKDIKNKNTLTKFHSTADCTNFRQLINHINRLDGWVMVETYNVDVHGRLIVDIFDPKTDKNIPALYLLRQKSSYCKYSWPNKS